MRRLLNTPRRNTDKCCSPLAGMAFENKRKLYTDSSFVPPERRRARCPRLAHCLSHVAKRTAMGNGNTANNVNPSHRNPGIPISVMAPKINNAVRTIANHDTISFAINSTFIYSSRSLSGAALSPCSAPRPMSRHRMPRRGLARIPSAWTTRRDTAIVSRSGPRAGGRT